MGQQSKMRFRGICAEIYLDRRALALDPGSPEDLRVLPPLLVKNRRSEEVRRLVNIHVRTKYSEKVRENSIQPPSGSESIALPLTANNPDAAGAPPPTGGCGWRAHEDWV